MSVMVIACYKPKPGKEAALKALTKRHLPVLRAEGLVGDDPAICGEARDGTIVEVFSWKSQEAIDKAHENAAVVALWDEYAKVCDYIPIADVDGAKDMFASFSPLKLD